MTSLQFLWKLRQKRSLFLVKRESRDVIHARKLIIQESHLSIPKWAASSIHGTRKISLSSSLFNNFRLATFLTSCVREEMRNTFVRVHNFNTPISAGCIFSVLNSEEFFVFRSQDNKRCAIDPMITNERRRLRLSLSCQRNTNIKYTWVSLKFLCESSSNTTHNSVQIIVK